ncbi:phytanoyl-CoA dioxygenase family protein [Paenibacillus hodogayensis]|uniref:Phytanoyl-CoA dioxygenase family protein n=1 Tax=Paenibacillus hodogayensis TaxID=279208 RepID=A0ABV5VZH7_9BACL
MEQVISAEMRDFFHANGYILVKGVVPKQNCDSVIETIWAFTGQRPDDPESWYQPASGMDTFWKHQREGMLPLFHHQTMWDNRQHPRLYRAFAELLEEERLWVSIDRVNMKPPRREDFTQFNTGFIHWDTDTSKLTFPLPRPPRVQGVLYLADTAADQGGFQCVPSLYRDFESWIAAQPDDRHPTLPDITGHDIVPIPGEAGDLLIWDVLLAHGNGQNYTSKPRFAQYISMFPAVPGVCRDDMVEGWRNRTGPSFAPEDPRGWERGPGTEPARLTELGRKLLGQDPWP